MALRKLRAGAFIVLILTQVITFSGCINAPGSPEKITKEELVKRTSAAREAVRTYQYDMGTVITLSGDGPWFSKEMTTSYRSNAIVDRANKIEKLTMTVDVSSLSQVPAASTPSPSQTATLGAVVIETYFSGGLIYVGTKREGIPTQWVKREAPAGNWEDLDLVGGKYAALDASQIEIAGEEKVDWKDCYVVQVTPDKARILERMSQQLSGNQQGTQKAVPEDMIREMSETRWFAKDTFLPLKEYVKVTVVMSQKDAGIPGAEEGAEIRTVSEMNVVFVSYNAPISINIPVEARQATQTTTVK